ncbi:galactokinase [Streptomyces inusitatus]|uniref:Galactokinase n=1 Tax=Streptomyces inusitatus TaxID=68221 RepID=A0A918PVC6_9ACTN|nr:galactokinase [Streptomyces inusitatus]
MSEGVWEAPGRVNLIGEHTDYNDGLVMPFALSRTVVATAARRDDGILRLHSADAPGAPGGQGTPGGPVELRVDALAPGRGPRGWTDYPAGVLWALREAGHRVGGADLHYESTLPAGAGLSSSAALEVVTALAVTELYGVELGRREMALICRRAENAYAGAPTGIMDQTASACCAEGHALYLDTRDLSRRQIPFDPAAHGLALLLIDTGVKHAHSTGAYGERRAGCESAAAALGLGSLREIPQEELPGALTRLTDPVQRALTRHVVTENGRVERVRAALEAGRARAIGPLLTEGHASLRDDFAVSCPELDLAVRAALAAGALGARMTGGGFGGSAIALVEASARERVAGSVERAFAEASFRRPEIFAAAPAAGARRLS